MMRTTIFLLALLLFVGRVYSINGKQPTAAQTSWADGVASVKSGALDSADILLKSAFSAGIGEDSLYYLWSAIFLAKGVYDTALALNYAITLDSSRTLYKEVLLQRYTIYSTLGWEREAALLLDTLKRTPKERLRRFIPEGVLYLSGGGYAEQDVADRNYPYATAADSMVTFNNGAGVASLRLGWRIPVDHKRGFVLGGRGRYAGSRFSVASSTTHLADSAEAAYGGYVRFWFMEELGSLEYAYTRNWGPVNGYSLQHDLSLRLVFLAGAWLGSTEAGYRYETPQHEHYYYLMTYWTRDVARRHNISVSCYLSGLSADLFTVQDMVSYYHFRDSSLYRDASFTTPVATKVMLYGTQLSTALFDRAIPQSYWGVNPRLEYTLQLGDNYAAGVGSGYLLTWYRQKYSWLDKRYPADAIPMTPNFLPDPTTTVLNGADGQYYWVRSSVTPQSIVLDSLPFFYQSRQRIDQTISMNLFFKRSLGYFGSAQINLDFRRNFSTLMHDSPVAIQKWYGEVMLRWFFRFKPDRLP